MAENTSEERLVRALEYLAVLQAPSSQRAPCSHTSCELPADRLGTNQDGTTVPVCHEHASAEVDRKEVKVRHE